MRPALVAIVATLGAVLGGLALAQHPTAAADHMQATPAEHLRTPDQTFLTFPEWYLVHSPAEYAAFLANTEHPSAFPLYSHIGQFWQSYGAVNREIDKYPFNSGYHVMVMVIGASTTVEYGLKGLYEHSVGRLAEASKTTRRVPEEDFAARFSQSYVDFIRLEPWYKFDFWSQLQALWADVPWSGPDLLRRWERRFALSSELLIKEGYARLIKLGTQSVYDAPKPVTAVVLSRSPKQDAGTYSDFNILESGPMGQVLATIPRYEAFTTYSQWIAAQGIDFLAIAGNDGEVVLSELVPLDWSPAGVRLLFEQPILTQPGRKRVVLATRVAGLADELRRAQQWRDQIVIEHVYDF